MCAYDRSQRKLENKLSSHGLLLAARLRQPASAWAMPHRLCACVLPGSLLQGPIRVIYRIGPSAVGEKQVKGLGFRMSYKQQHAQDHGAAIP